MASIFRRGFFIFCLSLLAISCAPRRPSAPDSSDAVVPYNPPSAEEWKLENGLTVLFIRDPELPMITGTLYLRGGSLWEPKGKRGIVSAMGTLMRQGGAGRYSADQLDKKLDQMSASVSSDYGGEFGVFGFDCLASDFDEVFPIFSQVVLAPRFETDRLNLWRGMALEGIRRRRDDPDTIADISFTQALFSGTAYGQIVGERDVKAVSRADLIAQHKHFVRPDGGYLVVSGDISRAELERMIYDNFASWEARGAGFSAPPPVDVPVEKAIYFITMPFEQSTVVMGQRGVPRLTPDVLAIDGFNKIFGSLGFGSRLMNRIRSELGLVYGISGAISAGVVQGKNTIYLQTKAVSTGDAIVESLEILKSMQRGPILEHELKLMKDTSINSFVFKFDSVQELVQRYALLRLLGYPADYDLKYIPGMRALTPDDIQKVAQSRWDISQFIYVVVGNETAYDSLVKAREKENSPLASVRLIKAEFNQRLEAPGIGMER